MRKPTNFINQESICLEIGVWKGDYSKEILNNNPKKLYLIDPWSFQPSFSKRWYGGTKAKSQKDMNNIFEEVQQKFSNNSNVKIIRKTSDEAVGLIENSFLDWIYIDGNHEYEYVKNDLYNYYPKMKETGYITGDDYDWSDPRGVLSVKKAVDEFIKDKKLHALIEGGQFIIKCNKKEFTKEELSLNDSIKTVGLF